MGNVFTIPNREIIEQEACAWIARFDARNMSAQEIAEFRTWIGRSEMHRDCFNQYLRTWKDFEEFSERSVSEVLDTFAEEPKPLSALGKLTGGWSNAIGRQAAITAVVGFLMIALLGIAIRFVLNDGGGQPLVIYATAVGENKSVSLADGTQIRLNTNSRMEVTYTKQERSIRLLKGEAFFDVIHDPKRPLVVYAGSGLVQAIGTAFVVRLKDADVEVLVTEGRVRLASMTEPGSHLNEVQSKTSIVVPLAVVESGQNAKFAIDVEAIDTISSDEIERKLAWRDGALIFKGDPLEHVIEEVGRYTPIKIVISDPQIRDMKIGGYFRTGEVEAMLDALEESFSIRVMRINDRLIYLSKMETSRVAN